MIASPARSSLAFWTLLGILAAPASAQSPTLLKDLSTAAPSFVTNGEVRVTGTALGRLWLSGSRVPEATRTWSLSGPGAEPQPLSLPAPASINSTLLQVADLGPGRALLVAGASLQPAGSAARLLVTDGSSDGTLDLGVLLQTTGEPFGTPESTRLIVVGDRAYGLGTIEGVGSGVIETDGTLSGTRLLAAAEETGQLFLAGTNLIYDSGSQLLAVPLQGGTPTTLGFGVLLGAQALGNGLVFSWLEAGQASGVEPWFTDGTAAGTLQLRDIAPGPDGSSPSMLAASGTQGWFSALSTSNGVDIGRELWVTDGTPAGTRLVADVSPGPQSGVQVTARGAAFGGDLFFSARNGSSGFEVFRSDGTAAGTGLFADLNPGAGNSFPGPYLEAGGRLAFTAQTGVGRRTFSTDGSGVVDHSAAGLPGEPLDLTPFAGEVWFSGVEAATGRELWSLDLAVAASSQLELDLGLESGTLSSSPYDFVRAGDQAFFVALILDSLGFVRPTLYATDGTAAGTRALQTSQGIMGTHGALDRSVLFSASTAQNGREPWFSNGTIAGTLPLGDLTPGPGSSDVSSAAQLGDRLLFLARAGNLGRELWGTDGTPGGTGLIAEFAPGPGSLSFASELVSAADRVYVLARAGGSSSPNALWVSDGTGVGTAKVDEALLAGVEPRKLLGGTDRLVFTAGAGNSAPTNELWATSPDEGTVPLYAAADTLFGVERVGDRIVFQEGGQFRALLPDGAVIDLPLPVVDPSIALLAGDGVYYFVPGAESTRLFFTDGSAAGSVDLGLSPGGLVPLASGSEAAFYTTSDATGTELSVLRPDGSTSTLLADFEPGPASSNPIVLGQVRGTLVVRAYNQATGIEPHVVDLADAGAFVAEPFGQGCGSVALGDLELSGEARIGELISLDVSDLPAGSPALFYASTSANAAPLDTCTLYLGPPIAIGTSLVDAAGEAQLPVLLSNPAFAGAAIYLQTAAVVFGGPALGLLELTNGLEVVIGQP